MKKFLLSLSLCFSLDLAAQVRLPAFIRDSMILQRETKVPVWGWAKPNEKITVRISGRRYRTHANASGQWRVELAPFKAGGPFTMQIDGTNRIVLKEILFGDVWLASGQSNMQHSLKLHAERYAEEIAKANEPEIRQLLIPPTAALQGAARELPPVSWKWANPGNVRDFSVVAYFFAKEIHQRTGVPIGIIQASVGGSPIEAWIDEEHLRSIPELARIIDRNKDTAMVNDLLRRKAVASNRTSLKTEDERWKPIQVPGYWEDQGLRNLDGIVWYRKQVQVPAAMVTGTVQLSLGRIVDADKVWINEVEVGQTTYQYPQRRYIIPAGVLKAGNNTIMVRVENGGGKGGFVPGKPYYLHQGTDSIDLCGEWQYRVAEVFLPNTNPDARIDFNAQYAPAALFNGMLAPLAGYPIRGALWYQGESNTGNPGLYAQLLPILIANWRERWQQPGLPFLYVQLPLFGEADYLPAESGMAALRDAQRRSLSIAGTGMAVTLDLGEWNDIHPGRKKEVGERLALLARKQVYGEAGLTASGPMIASAEQRDEHIILRFSSTGKGLITPDGSLPAGFHIAGADKKFRPARARIAGDSVVLDAGKEQVRFVRYAWADNPALANLFNCDGLPASPFEITVQKLQP